MTISVIESCLTLLSGLVFPLCVEVVVRVGLCRAYEVVREEKIPAILKGAGTLFSAMALVNAAGAIWYSMHSLFTWTIVVAYLLSTTVFFGRARILEVKTKAKAEQDGERPTRGM